jgi:hypothetical protein
LGGGEHCSAGQQDFDADADSYFNGAEYYWSGHPLNADSPVPSPRIIGESIIWALSENTPDDVVLTLLRSTDMVNWESIYDTITGPLIPEVSKVTLFDGNFEITHTLVGEAAFYRFELKLTGN